MTFSLAFGVDPVQWTVSLCCLTDSAFANGLEGRGLICGADSQWEARETCEVGERCDSVNDATAGACRMPLPECETGSDEPFCGDAGVEVCNPGGFDTEVLDACGADDLCLVSGCIPGPDECPSNDAIDCTGECEAVDMDCIGNSSCEFGLRLNFEDAAVLRLSSETPCPMTFPSCPAGNAFQVAVRSIDFADEQHPEHWIRVTMEPGWEMYPAYIDDSEESNSCRAPVEECLVLQPAELEEPPLLFDLSDRHVHFYPLTDPPIARNVTFEIVPEGTTCE